MKILKKKHLKKSVKAYASNCYTTDDCVSMCWGQIGLLQYGASYCAATIQYAGN
jgi:putative bacteriocin precursor